MRISVGTHDATITHTEKCTGSEVRFYKCGEDEEQTWLDGVEVLDSVCEGSAHAVASIAFDQCKASFVRTVLLCIGKDEEKSSHITSIKIGDLDAKGVYNLIFHMFENLEALDLSQCDFSGKRVVGEDGSIEYDAEHVVLAFTHLESEIPRFLKKLMLGSSAMSLEADESDMGDVYEALVAIKETILRPCDAFRFERIHKKLFKKYESP